MPRISKENQSRTDNKSIHWRVAIYIRLSKDDGNEESYSVQNQRERLTDYFNELLLEEDMLFVDYYIDDGFTGVDSDRDDFQRLLNDIHTGKVNCVIVKDLSRLSRNDWECKYYLQFLFVDKDVRFISLELPKLDSYKRPDDIYDLGVSFQSMYNENHCRETSIKIRGTLNKKREKGKFIGAFAPYGYLKDPSDRHHFIIDTVTAPVVKDIFNWYVYEGMNKNAIVSKLNDLGIPCPAVYKRDIQKLNYENPAQRTGDKNVYWCFESVRRILKNPTYCGHMVQGRHKVKSYKIHKIVPVPESDWFWVYNTHEAIIDEETFNKAQDLLARDVRTSPKEKRVFLFSGYLRCADCGRGMTRRTSKGYTYYSCKTYKTKSTKLCSSHTIRDKLIEETVLEAVKAQIALCEKLSETIDAINNAPVRQKLAVRYDSLLEAKQAELIKVTGIFDNLYMDWKMGEITREQYHRMKANLGTKIDELKEVIENLQKERATQEVTLTSENPYLQTFLKYRNIEKLERSIVVELIHMIYIHENKKITIEFNFADQHKRIMEYIEQSKKLEQTESNVVPLEKKAQKNALTVAVS